MNQLKNWQTSIWKFYENKLSQQGFLKRISWHKFANQFNEQIQILQDYTTQNYNGFPTSDIRSGGKFDGLVFQAVVGF